MTKCIIFKCKNDHKNKYTIYFCVDNNFYMSTSIGYAELHQSLKDVKNSKIAKRIPKMKERIELMEKLASMNYKEASKFYFDYQKSKNREGTLLNGEFNAK